MYITLEDFVLLPIDEQAQLVWEHGQYLISRQGQRTTANLYAVAAFYVEIWYDREQNSITAITCFDDVSKLDSYLKGISLDEL
jgi:hypothetical protein